MRKAIGKKTTFQVTAEQKTFIENTAERLEVPVAALIRGIIRVKKGEGEKR